MSVSFDILPTKKSEIDCKVLVNESLERLFCFLSHNGISKEITVNVHEFSADGEEFCKPKFITMEGNKYTVLRVNDIGELYIYFHRINDLEIECWNEVLLTNNTAKQHEREIHKFMNVGYSWEIKKTISQPPLVSLYFGFVSMVIANLSEGLVYSDDGAWEYSSMPMGFGEFEKTYLNLKRVNSKEIVQNVHSWISDLR